MYIASFIVGIITAVIFGIDLGQTQEIPPILWYTGAFASVIIASGFAFWYFHSPKVSPGAKAGFSLGVIMIITGFILDFMTLLPLLTHDNPWEPILGYYLAPLFWVTLLLVLLATTLTGKYIASKQIVK